MARVKFLVFALVVLGLWGSHLFLLSPSLGAQAVASAGDRVAAAPHALVVQLVERRAELQRAALKLASAPASGTAAGTVKGTAPTAEKLAELRASVGAGLSAELRDALVLALVNDAGAVASRGTVPLDVSTLDLKGLAQAGAEGVARDLGGEVHHFHAIAAGGTTVVLGGPAFSQELLDRAVAAAGVPAMGVLRNGKVLAMAGAQRGSLGDVAASVKAGPPAVVARGEAAALGPVMLPLATAGDALGGGAATWVGARTAVPELPLEVVSLASLSAFNTALAEYQLLALVAFAGLLFLTVVFALILRTPPAPRGAAAPVPSVALVNPPVPQPQAAPPVAAPEASYADAAALPELPPAPEAVPDDFPFGEPQQPPPPPPPVADAYDAPSHAPVHAMPFDPPADPFAQAAAQGGMYGESEGLGDSPEATRVAAVPAELLQQAARANDAMDNLPQSSGGWAPPPVAAGGDDAHFLEVYQSFVQTRAQCGEAADGLTYDKFAQKLRKNREQLTAKYQCRTVRFQVYVKEGKAALKATPIKD